MSPLKSFFISLKLNKAERSCFKNIIENIKIAESLESKLDKKYKDEYSITYLGIAYEFFLIGLNDLGLEYFKKVSPSNYENIFQRMTKSDVFLVTSLVVYDNVKEEESIKSDYFFKIFESKLENYNFKYPNKESFNFDAFNNAWKSLYSSLPELV